MHESFNNNVHSATLCLPVWADNCVAD